MGRRVVALAAEDPRFRIAATLDHWSHPDRGVDAGTLAGCGAIDVPLGCDWPEDVDGVIDFSLPPAVPAVVAQCVAKGWPLVIATTGLEEEQIAAIHQAAARIPLVWAPSMSLAVNLAMRLASDSAAALATVPGGVDIEIIERHHRYKADAPSGTALKFGQLIAANIAGPVQHVHGRHGKTGARGANEIGYHAVRGGDHPGEHTIVFGMLGETLEIRVAASNRDCYAAGALAAVHWLQGRAPGLYSMFDVLGLEG